MIAAEASKTMSGLELIKAIQVGELPGPPIAELIGMWVAEASEGRVVIAIEPAEYHYNPLGMVHGGIAATLLDTAMGLAVVSMLPAATGFTTLELKVNYVRPLTDKTGMMYCEGKIIHMGSRIATAEGRLTEASGKLYAHVTTTCLVSRHESLLGKGWRSVMGERLSSSNDKLLQPGIILVVLRQERAALRQQLTKIARASEGSAPVYSSYAPLDSNV